MYYPRIHRRNKIGLNELATIISEKCTLRRADIFATLIALTDEIPELLKNNYSIQLGELGTFSVHATCKPSASAEEVTNKNIAKLRVSFRPGTEIKTVLKTAGFKKVVRM